MVEKLSQANMLDILELIINSTNVDVFLIFNYCLLLIVAHAMQNVKINFV